MEEDLWRRRGDACSPPAGPRLLDLIPMERKYSRVQARDSGGCGFFGVEEEEEEEEEEKKVELRLGPPPLVKEEASVQTPLGNYYCPKASSKPSSKRGLFSDAAIETKKQASGFLQSQPTDASGRAEQQGLERKACCAQPAAHNDASASASASGNIAAVPNNNTSQTRTASVPVVGWPPIRSFRKNLATTSSKPSPVSQNGSLETGAMFENCNKGLFVKINMDGIPIGRKVDLKAYDSYEKLSSAVEELFRDLLAAQKDPPAAGAQMSEQRKQAFTHLLDGSGEYTLVYEDNEGDKMLVGDVPWDMFIATAKRLRVLKSSELSSLSLGAISRKRTATEC